MSQGGVLSADINDGPAMMAHTCNPELRRLTKENKDKNRTPVRQEPSGHLPAVNEFFKGGPLVAGYVALHQMVWHAI